MTKILRTKVWSTKFKLKILLLLVSMKSPKESLHLDMKIQKDLITFIIQDFNVLFFFN